MVEYDACARAELANVIFQSPFTLRNITSGQTVGRFRLTSRFTQRVSSSSALTRLQHLALLEVFARCACGVHFVHINYYFILQGMRIAYDGNMVGVRLFVTLCIIESPKYLPRLSELPRNDVDNSKTT